MGELVDQGLYCLSVSYIGPYGDLLVQEIAVAVLAALPVAHSLEAGIVGPALAGQLERMRKLVMSLSGPTPTALTAATLTL